MAYELTITKNSTFANPELNKLTEEMQDAIIAVGAMAERTKVLCAKHIHTIDSKELYKEDGFESAVDFCKSVMGMSQSNAYAYIQVGREVNSGRLNLTDCNGKEFSFTQLRALAGIKKSEELTEGVNSGELNADMTEKEMKEAISTIQPKKERKPAPEKRFVWEIVGEGEETADMTKTELIAQMNESGMQFLGELKSDEVLYICAIDAGGFPVMYRRGNEVKKVVEAEK